MSYKLLPKQKEFIEISHEHKLDVALYQGGYGCVCGDTLLHTPTGYIKIKDFEGGLIYSYKDGKVIKTYATLPKIYDKKPLYEVITHKGFKITCTMEHKFLTKKGFMPLSSLSVGTSLRILPPSSLEHDLSKSFLDGQRLWQKVQDFLLHYFGYYCQDDVQPHSVVNTCQDGLPSQCDVHECSHYDSQKGGHCISKEHNHSCQDNVHHSKSHYAHQLDHLFSNKEYYSVGKFFELPLQSCLKLHLSLLNSCLDKPLKLFSQWFHNLFETYFNTSCYDTIKSITYSRVDSYYDLHVPETNCYIANGFVNHNSGKTFAGSLLGILLCLQNPNIRGLVGALTTPLVIDTTLVSYFEHLDNMGFVEGRDYFYKKGAEKIIFANNSEIMFRHLEEPNKLKSLNLGFVEIEEMSDIPEDTFKMLLARLRQSGVKRYRLFGHTNPEQNKGWIYKTFIENPKENYRLIISPTTDNTYLPEHFVEELRGAYDPEYFRINVMGEFGDYAKGLVVKGFNKEKQVANLKYIDVLPLHLTCDFNVDPMCWAVAHKDGNDIFFIDEIVIENTNTEEAIQEFIRRYQNHKDKIIIHGDASGDNRSVNNEFTNYMIMKNALLKAEFEVDIKIRSYNPPIKNRIASFNHRVKSADGNHHIYIDSKCVNILNNIDNLKYKAGTSLIDVPTVRQLKNERSSKFLGHMFDAISYMVEFYFPISPVRIPEKENPVKNREFENL